MAYTDQQINEFLALAQEVGITKAKRELGYPNSWATGQRWAQMRGVQVATDEVMAKAKSVDQWYKDEEVMLIAQEGFVRIHEELTTNPALTADDQKKLSEALTKHYNVWANIKGRATTISETRTPDAFEESIQELLNIEIAKNRLKTTEATSPSES